MAKGNPLLAKQIYAELDHEWYLRWMQWQSARSGEKPGKPVKPGMLEQMKQKLGWRGRK